MSDNETLLIEERVVMSWEYVSHIVYIVEGFLMVVGNGLLIVAMVAHREMRQKELFMIVGLAVGDWIYGMGIFSGGIRRLHLVLTLTDRVKNSAWQCLQYFPTIFYLTGSQMTALMMVLMSVDRYIAVAYFSRYVLFKNSYAYKVILFLFAFGAGTTALAFASSYGGWGEDTHIEKWPALCLSTWAIPNWYAVGYSSFNTICSYLSIIIYGLVLVAYRNYVKSTVSNSGGISEIQLLRQRKLTVTMAFVTLVTLCFHAIPYTVIILTTVVKLRSTFVGILGPYMWVLVCVNSLVNIFIYLKRHRDIRRAIWDVMRCRFGGGAGNHNAAAVHPRVVTVT